MTEAEAETLFNIWQKIDEQLALAKALVAASFAGIVELDPPPSQDPLGQEGTINKGAGR